MALATYELIQSVTLTTTTATVTLGSGGTIPSTYTDLFLFISARSNRSGADSDGMYMALNGNGGTNFISAENIGGNAYSHQTANYGGGWVGTFTATNATSNVFGNMSIYIPNYLSNVSKTYSTDSAAESASGSIFSNAFSAGLNTTTTAPVTSISFSANGSFIQYSNFYLYGIKNS
jgi:hypothetical protein